MGVGSLYVAEECAAHIYILEGVGGRVRQCPVRGVGLDGGVYHHLGNLSPVHRVPRLECAIGIATKQPTVVARFHVVVECRALGHIAEVRSALRVDWQVEGAHHDLGELSPGCCVVRLEAGGTRLRAWRRSVVAVYHARAEHVLHIRVEPVACVHIFERYHT